MEDWKSEIQKSFSDVIAKARGYEGGDQVDPSLAMQSKNELLSNIQTEEENDNGKKTHYLDFLKNKSEIGEIYKLIKNKKLSNNKIKQEIKNYLKNPEDIKTFLETILDNKKTKKETKEATGTGSAGGYEAPLFSGEEPKKVEATEATDSSSSGSYVTTAAWAKSLSKKE